MQESCCICLFSEFGFSSDLIERGGCMQYAIYVVSWSGKPVGTYTIVHENWYKLEMSYIAAWWLFC